MDREIPFITSSIINQYVNCKYSFYKDYIEENGFSSYRENDEDEQPIYLTFGTIVHGVIEKFWKSPKSRTLKFLKSTYEQNIIDYGFTDKSYIELGYDMLENFFNYLKTEVPPRKALHSELGFNVVIGGVPLSGHIDQVFYHGDGIYEIEDYKTSKWVKPQDEVDEDIQLSMYDLVFSDDSMKEYWFNGIKPKAIILSLHFLRYGELVKTERTKYSRVNTLSYFRTIYKQMQKLDASKFRPSINNLCGYCSNRGRCEKYQSVLDDTYLPKEMKDFDSIEEYNLAMYLDLKARTKILDNATSEYYDKVYSDLENIDMLSYNGYDYFISQGGRRYVKTNVAKQILEEHGLWNPMDFVKSIPLGKLESIVKGTDAEDEIMSKAIGFNYNSPSLTSRKSPKLFKSRKR